MKPRSPKGANTLSECILAIHSKRNGVDWIDEGLQTRVLDLSLTAPNSDRMDAVILLHNGVFSNFTPKEKKEATYAVLQGLDLTDQPKQTAAGRFFERLGWTSVAEHMENLGQGCRLPETRDTLVSVASIQVIASVASCCLSLGPATWAVANTLGLVTAVPPLVKDLALEGKLQRVLSGGSNLRSSNVEVNIPTSA